MKQWTVAPLARLVDLHCNTAFSLFFFTVFGLVDNSCWHVIFEIEVWLDFGRYTNIHFDLFFHKSVMSFYRFCLAMFYCAVRCAQIAHCMIVIIVHNAPRSEASTKNIRYTGCYFCRGALSGRLARAHFPNWIRWWKNVLELPYLFVMVVKGDNDRNSRVLHHAEEPIK